MEDPLFVLVVISVLVVAAVLIVGVVGFARGGEFNRKYGNKLMRLRIATQAVAVVLILIYIYTRGTGG